MLVTSRQHALKLTAAHPQSDKHALMSVPSAAACFMRPQIGNVLLIAALACSDSRTAAYEAPGTLTTTNLQAVGPESPLAVNTRRF